MDSLLSTYASSDEENDDQSPQPLQRPSNPLPSSSATSLFSLPPPKSTPLFSLPPPKSLNPPQNPKSDPASRTSSSLFNSVPAPRSKALKIQENRLGKKVVQFTPPVMNLAGRDEESDEEDEGEKERKRRREAQNSAGEAPSVKSFLSSVLPAPKHSKAVLGAAAGQGGGAGRRSVIDAEVPSLKQQQVQIQTQQQQLEYEASVFVDSNAVASNEAGSDGYGYGDDYGTVRSGGGDSSLYQVGGGGEAYGDYSGGGGGGYESYGGAYPQYESNWIDKSGGGPGSYSAMPEAPDVDVTMARVMGKRGRNVIPAENIIEVRQDELMKNRPREDQVKTTGIAFGPAYQPASSEKGKPSKLHKRKHQIGALYFDMKQKETELADRRARGFLTKAETHAKYGW